MAALNLRQQIMFVRNLGALLGAGLALDASLSQLARLMPRQRRTLEDIAKEVSVGRPLSRSCDTLLPPELVSAIAVGEQSGNMVAVLKEIRDTLLMRERIAKTVSGLYKPAAMLAVGIMVFIGFVVGVIPTLSETSSKLSRGSEEPGGLMAAMASMAHFFKSNGFFMLGLSVVIIIALIAFSRTPQGRVVLYGAALKVPFVGLVMRYTAFAMWARYLALMWRSGFSDMSQAIEVTRKSMPEYFHPGIEAYRQDISRGRGLGASCDPTRLPDDDQRCSWPIFLQIALQISEKTMETDEQLTSASGYLLEDAELAVNTLVEFSKTAVIAVVAVTALLPIIAYMYEIVTMVSGTMGKLR